MSGGRPSKTYEAMGEDMRVEARQLDPALERILTPLPPRGVQTPGVEPIASDPSFTLLDPDAMRRTNSEMMADQARMKEQAEAHRGGMGGIVSPSHPTTLADPRPSEGPPETDWTLFVMVVLAALAAIWALPSIAAGLWRRHRPTAIKAGRQSLAIGQGYWREIIGLGLLALIVVRLWM